MEPFAPSTRPLLFSLLFLLFSFSTEATTSKTGLGAFRFKVDFFLKHDVQSEAVGDMFFIFLIFLFR